jgi:hypothetical protein
MLEGLLLDIDKENAIERRFDKSVGQRISEVWIL